MSGEVRISVRRANWPSDGDDPPPGWERRDGLLRRVIDANEGVLPVPVEEAIAGVAQPPDPAVRRV